MRREKQDIKVFYNAFGWTWGKSGKYVDTESFVDTRPFMSDYLHRTHLRVKEFFNPLGKYFLDIGSGPVPHDEFLEYTYNYKKHVCADFSVAGLYGARKRLRGHGVYTNCDVTELPYKDDVFDTVLASHILYHIPKDEQEGAVQEWYRVLKPGGRLIIIYSYPMLFMPIIKSVLCIGNHLLHSYHLNHRSLKKILPEADIRCWRSVSPVFTKVFVHDWMFGRWVMDFIYWLEDRFPRIMGRFGRYPMIVVTK